LLSGSPSGIRDRYDSPRLSAPNSGFIMAVDLYAPCPCGSGKKLKFCCSDLVGQIEKIHRMIEGDQPRAALRYTEQTLAQHPRRASLLDLKATIELSLDELDAAHETVDQFVEAHPDSPIAHACHAMWLSAVGRSREAVGALQRALELVERDIPHRVFEAIGLVGRALLAGGHVVAAQAHLWLQAAVAPQGDKRALELLVSLNRYSGLPLLLRDPLRLRPWPVDAAWRGEVEEASRAADRGRWRQAVEIIDRLGRQYGAEPTLVFNRTVIGGWLADDWALVAGLHAFAQLDVPLDDAVQAEAVAQLLDTDVKEAKIDSLIISYGVEDLDALLARLSADRRIEPFDLDPATFAGSDQPRPRHVYVLLDRPLPESGVGLARGDVPRLAGVVAVYGRQTDRRERLELSIDRGPDFESAVGALREIAGNTLGEQTEERVIGSTTPTELALDWRWHFPPGTPREVRQTLLDEERRVAITERWPDVPRPGLRGRTPREASAEPELRIPLMAAVLILEQGNSQADPAAIASLRDELGLGQPESIRPDGIDAYRFPLARVPRLLTEGLSDDDLAQLYRRAVLAGDGAAILHLGREALGREPIPAGISPEDLYQRLIALEANPDRALALVDEARERSRAAGTSTGPWDLAELELHISTGSADKAQASLARIEAEHGDDPQMAAAVYRLLYESGLIPPDEELAADEAEEAAALAAGSPPPEPGRIWTPGSDRPSGGGKSKLWTPS
jgi:tetratricopeptide (TPR) repeat protein